MTVATRYPYQAQKPRGSRRRPGVEASRREDRPSYRELRRRLLAPIKIALTFSISTYLLFAFGVWDFPARHSPQLALWVLLFNVAMGAGFMAGIRNRNDRSSPTHSTKIVGLAERLLKLAFWVTCITFIPRLIIETQLYELRVDSLVTRFQVGLNDALNVYQRRAELKLPPGPWVYMNYVCVATGFIAWLYTPLAIVFWHRLSTVRRLLTVAFWVATVVSATARGQNFSIFDLGIRIIVFILVRRYFIVRRTAGVRGEKASTARINRPRIRMGYAGVAACLAVAMIGFFANTMRSRVGDRYNHLLSFGGQYVPINQQSLVWAICPDVLKPICATLLGYVSHGYMGLELSLRMPFDSTFGLGNSLFLIDNVKQMFGSDLMPLTYQQKVFESYGYHPTIQWHTAYAWIANDVSFWGVPIVLFALFYAFGSGWHDFVVARNLFGLLLMAPMATMVVFISANNQLTSSPNTLAAVIVLLICWSATKGRYDWSEAYKPFKAGGS